MARDDTLKSLLREFLVEFLSECMEYVKEVPIQKKMEAQFYLENNRYSSDETVYIDDYDEFFSRQEAKQLMLKNEDLKHIIGIMSSYKNIKAYSEPHSRITSNVIDTFVRNYVEDVGSMEFKNVEFQRTFERLTRFLKSNICCIDYFTPIFNLCDSTSTKEGIFKDVSLNLITAEQFKIIKEHMVGKNIATPGRMYNLMYVLNTTVPVQDNFHEENIQANKKFSDFVIAALLFHHGDLRLGSLYRNFTSWTRDSSTVINKGDATYGNQRYVLNNKEYRSFKIFYKKYLELDLKPKDWSFIQVSIDRFISSINRDNPLDRIVDLNVSLECMFSSSGDTSLKIANRTATLMSKNGESRELCWNFIKNEYKLRNDILHGRQPECMIDTKEIGELEDVVRICIRKFLNFRINISRDELRKQSKIKNSKTMRDYILDELDLCLINSTSRQNFLSNAEGTFTRQI